MLFTCSQTHSLKLELEGTQAQNIFLKKFIKHQADQELCSAVRLTGVLIWSAPGRP